METNDESAASSRSGKPEVVEDDTLSPRVGILRIETTRGDRLFMTLLGSAFINLAWLGLTDIAQYWALAVCVVYAAAVFRWV